MYLSVKEKTHKDKKNNLNQTKIVIYIQRNLTSSTLLFTHASREFFTRIESYKM